MATEIKIISTRDTYIVRQPVLREGRPVETCFFEGDELSSTIHLGYFTDKNLVGIISLYQKSSPLFSQKKQCQLRGMAVLPNVQKSGIGKALLTKAEEIAQQQNYELIWFNARESAVGFYEKTGYRIDGNSFDIPDVGKHFVMYKII